MVLRSPQARRRQYARIALTLARIGALFALIVLGAQTAATLTHSARQMTAANLETR